jgi:hypothetical protein
MDPDDRHTEGPGVLRTVFGPVVAAAARKGRRDETEVVASIRRRTPPREDDLREIFEGRAEATDPKGVGGLERVRLVRTGQKPRSAGVGFVFDDPGDKAQGGRRREAVSIPIG